MPVVSLEQDKRYRRDGDRYVEICVACKRDRAGAAEVCDCGTAFEYARQLADNNGGRVRS